MKRKIRSLCIKSIPSFCLLFVFVLVLCGFQATSLPITSVTKKDEIPFTITPTGSAGYLNGSTVLVSLFIEDPKSAWTEEDQRLVMSKMDIANDFLVEEGLTYDKTVHLIYDIYEHPDLAYQVTYSDVIRDDDRSSLQLLDYITDYINTQIPSQAIMEQYGVDSIGYMCFLNKSGVSYTFPYYEDDSDIYYYETCFIFLKCDGDYEPPAVYAHEMLHLFGARDLYATNETDGITKPFVQYIEQQYPNEIMLTTYDENQNNVQDHVSNDLTDITAYFIGWLDTIPELEEYPSIYYEYPASFGDVEDTTGDYSEYSAGDDERGGRWGADIDADTSSSSTTEEEYAVDKELDFNNRPSLLRLILRILDLMFGN